MKPKNIVLYFFLIVNLIISSVVIAKCIKLEQEISVIRVKPIVDQLDSIRKNSAAVKSSNMKMMSCLYEHVITCEKNPYHLPDVQ